MSKIVFDSDGLIKVAKSGVLEVVLGCFDSWVSEEVFQEAVVEGKKLQFNDAFVIDGQIEAGKLKVKKQLVYKSGAYSTGLEGLGAGEISSFHLFSALKANSIITAD